MQSNKAWKEHQLPVWLMHSQNIIGVLLDQSSTIVSANLCFWRVFQGETSIPFQFANLFTYSDFSRVASLCQPLFQSQTNQVPIAYTSIHEAHKLQIRWEFSPFPGDEPLCLGMGQPLVLEHTPQAHDERLKLLEKLAESLPVVIYQFHYTPSGQVSIPFISQQLADLWGIEPASVLQDGQRIFSAVHPDDLAAVTAQLQKNFLNKESWNYTFRIVHPKKGVRWMDSHGIPFAIAKLRTG